MDIQLETPTLTQEYGVWTTKLNPKRDIRKMSGSGLGDVVGPASAVNDNIAVFDGSSGLLIKDSGQKVTGFVTVDQSSPQTIGSDVLPMDKAYLTDLAVTNTIEGEAAGVLAKDWAGKMRLHIPYGWADAGQLKFYDEDETASGTIVGKKISFEWADTQWIFAKESNSATDYSHVVGRAIVAGGSEVNPTGKAHTARVYLGSDFDHYLVRDTDDLYWKNGTTYTKLNGGSTWGGVAVAWCELQSQTFNGSDWNMAFDTSSFYCNTSDLSIDSDYVLCNTAWVVVIHADFRPYHDWASDKSWAWEIRVWASFPWTLLTSATVLTIDRYVRYWLGLTYTVPVSVGDKISTSCDFVSWTWQKFVTKGSLSFMFYP